MRVALEALFRKNRSLLSILNDPNAPEKILGSYPWLLKNQAPHIPMPTFWQAIKDKHILRVGTKRCRDHLHYPAYGFPEQFVSEGADIVQGLFAELNRNQHSIMTRKISEMFIKANHDLEAEGKSVSFELHSIPIIRPNRIHITYGPYPPPEDFIIQDWLGSL